jgi:hypothetical protein
MTTKLRDPVQRRAPETHALSPSIAELLKTGTIVVSPPFLGELGGAMSFRAGGGGRWARPIPSASWPLAPGLARLFTASGGRHPDIDAATMWKIPQRAKILDSGGSRPRDGGVLGSL